MIRKILITVLVVCLLAGCSVPGIQTGNTIYEATFLTLFDTITTIRGNAGSEEEFTEISQDIHDSLLRYHQLFDIYNDYDGLNNLKTINDQAGVAPVEVDEAIISLLRDCREYYALTEGRINVAMGSVLKLWHDARNEALADSTVAALPDMGALKAAAEHISFENVVIDAENATVFLTDPQTRLDVGAVAKGWAVQRVAEGAPGGILISVGGNVCATGPKDEKGSPWIIGVQNPDGADYLHTLYISEGNLVTSGDYQRAYMVDGKLYHHIIDPETLMPSTYWRSVTIVCDDSALADALSTALFLMPREQGQQLLEHCGASAMWVDAAGQRYYSPGFEAMIRT